MLLRTIRRPCRRRGPAEAGKERRPGGARLASILLIAVGLALGVPAVAHENHLRAAEEVAAPAAPQSGLRSGPPTQAPEEQAEAVREQPTRTFSQRLVSWVGRTHPFAVHFPIALFPVALVALILARRRGEKVELIRAIIIVAGASTLVSAVLGWITGGLPLQDPDAVHFWHRWIGTGLAVAGALLAAWVWHRRESVYGPGLVLALGLMTALLLVQGWLGAALVHGPGHMNF